MEEIYSHVTCKDGTPTDEELEELGVKIGESWKKLGRRLDVTDTTFLEIGEAHNQLSERAYYMLKHWKQEKGSGATYQALCGALKHKLVRRQDLAEQFCSINGPFASHLPAGQVIREVPGPSAGVYSGTLAKYQEHSSEVKNILKRKSSDPNPEQGKKFARAFIRYLGNQLQDSVKEREKVNKYMKQKTEEVLSQGIFDLSTTVGLRHLYTYLVGELHCFGHLNVVAKKCLITEEVQEELGMACKSSLMETPESASVATSLSTASNIPSTVMAAAAEAVGVPAPPVESGHEESFSAQLQSLNFAKAHPTQGVGGPCPPKRPGYGTVGCPIRLRANFFHINVSSELSDLYHCDVEITPNKCPGTVKRDVVNEIIKRYKDKVFQGHCPAFDGKTNLYSRIKPLPSEFSVELPGEDGRKGREFKVKIQFEASVSLLELNNFLSDEQNCKVPQDAVQALDTIMREVPSLHYSPVGRSFFPFDGQGRPLGEGCELEFGFHSNVRHSEWKTMLVNIDVSAKGFYKKQNVIDFICETLGQGVTPQSLEDCNFQLDKHRLEKAICGIRMETTHEASIKRKYTARGVSSISAEKLQFEVEDRSTGRKSKTTVAMYFKNKYKLHLRYPHLPCLQVGQKKDLYLPMEVCTIIPYQKRHLSGEQMAKIFRHTACSAPERQQAIQNWAQKMIQTNSKYLREEFQTTVSPEMVRVDGRVLPAPKIKLGSQDQALVPQNGSWNMHNKMLHEGAHISTWALACFASRCSRDQLRNFCNQMASVSSQEGMQMAEQPAAVEYLWGFCDVESLFSKWVVDYPQLQLIIAVLPDKDKELYPEIKRVGDSVLGIATQCVQIKQAQQAKPLVCANLCLKINSKLGGVNHVIEPSEKSPTFRKPVIIFGADVTHLSPTGNGIPSIAAVVASMDVNATKYCTRVQVQRHEKLGGAQELINDLAVMVKELLIEFYKANRGIKPSKIIFYRDGVSETQFGQALVHEVGAIQQACMMLEKEYRPRITFVVVQKCHRTRLFCEDRQDASGKARNVPPGTIVDSAITHPYEFDFYLCSHFGIQGTSRPTHYHVLYDDNAFTGDDLQQLTYQLCYLYARCTHSVSIPAPAYYAHLVAFRAKHHVTNGRSGDTVDLERSARAIQVSDRMKGAMYFT